MSIASEITLLNNTKQSIKASVNAKGGNITENTPFIDYGTAISNLPSGSTGNPVFVSSDVSDVVGSGGFEPKSHITQVTIPSTATSIANSAFSNYSGLKSVTIPNSVTSIGQNVFLNCSSLAAISIPSTVTTIGDSAFSGCSGLTTLHIPSSVTKITRNSFNGCSGLASITVDSENTVYDSRDNCNAIVVKSTNTLLIGCKNTVIPNTVTTIDNYAFYSCSGLTSVDIPSTVTRIGTNSFFNCSGLTSVTVNATTPPTVGSLAFDSTNECPIYVPAASVDAYKAATNWSRYASRIQAIPAE